MNTASLDGMVRAGLVSLLVAAGCSFTSDPSGTMFLCAEDPMDCPPGMTCADGVCVDPSNVSIDSGVADADPSDAVVTDAPGPMPDAEPVDICMAATSAAATNICGTTGFDATAAARMPGGVTFYGNTRTYTNQLGSAVNDAACLGGTIPTDSSLGADAYYRVDVSAGETVTATLRGVEWDTVLYLIRGCSTAAECMVAQNITPGTGETITFPVSEAGSYSVVVDAMDSPAVVDRCYALDIAITGG